MSARNKRNKTDRLNAFDEKTELEQVADEIFVPPGGASPPPEFNTGRLLGRPISIDEIWADVRQPRRVVPASIRLVWNGSPKDVPQLLETWASVAANAAGRTIDIQAIIQGDGDGVDTDGTPAIYESFIALLRLAGSILRDGLINPITIVDQRDRHLIESGERRWLAYWLLHLHTQAAEEFARIPAVVASGADFVWRQAAENTARRSLNAVGMARQLALLIMAARGQDSYTDYDQIVPAGSSDRRFYAQVADGNTHRIPKGAGERIQAAMALSESQLAQYRRLLHMTDDDEINDLLWMRGDIEDWPETAFRQIYTFTLVKVREILSRDGWSLDDFRAAAQAAQPKSSLPPPGAPVQSSTSQTSTGSTTLSGAEAEEAARVIAQIRQAYQRVYAIENSPDGSEQIAATRATRLLNQAENFYERNRMVSAQASLDEAFRILDEAATAAANRQPNPPPPTPAPGDTVQARSGQIGTLIEVNGRWAIVDTPNGRKKYDMEHLQKVDVPQELSEPSTPTSMWKIYDTWRGSYPKGDLVLITQDGNTYIAIGQDDSTLRFKVFKGDWEFGSQNIRAGHIGVTGSADHTLVTKIDADLFAEVVGQYQGNVLVISYADLDEKMQHVAGLAFRAHNIPLNSLPQPDEPDQADDDEPTGQPPDGGFMIGDIVNTKLGRTGGEILAINQRSIRVQFPGSPSFETVVDNLIFVERPARDASDKSPSDRSQPQGRVVEYNTKQFTLLMSVKTLASVTGHKDIFDTLEGLLDMDWNAARQLTADGNLPDTLQLYFDSINNVLSEVSTTLGEFLDDLNHQLAE